MSTTLTPLQGLAIPQDWAADYQTPSDIETPIASARPNTTQSSSESTQSSSTGGVFAWLNNYLSQWESHVADYVAIALGLILILGAVFTFKSVSGATVNVAKKGIEAASVA